MTRLIHLLDSVASDTARLTSVNKTSRFKPGQLVVFERNNGAFMILNDIDPHDAGTPIILLEEAVIATIDESGPTPQLVFEDMYVRCEPEPPVSPVMVGEPEIYDLAFFRRMDGSRFLAEYGAGKVVTLNGESWRVVHTGEILAEIDDDLQS